MTRMLDKVVDGVMAAAVFVAYLCLCLVVIAGTAWTVVAIYHAPTVFP